MKKFPKRILRIIVGLILFVILSVLLIPALILWILTGNSTFIIDKIIDNDIIGNIVDWVLIDKIAK